MRQFFINARTIWRDAMDAVRGLHFDGGIPPWVKVDDIGGGQVQAHAACFQADEEKGNSVVSQPAQ